MQLQAYLQDPHFLIVEKNVIYLVYHIGIFQIMVPFGVLLVPLESP
jgi:hypothetical protein